MKHKSDQGKVNLAKVKIAILKTRADKSYHNKSGYLIFQEAYA